VSRRGVLVAAAVAALAAAPALGRGTKKKRVDPVTVDSWSSRTVPDGQPEPGGALTRVMPDIEACLGAAPPAIEGYLVVHVVFGKKGTVTDARVAGAGQARACVVKVLKKLTIPATGGEVVLQAGIPFDLYPRVLGVEEPPDFKARIALDAAASELGGLDAAAVGAALDGMAPELDHCASASGLMPVKGDRVVVQFRLELAADGSVKDSVATTAAPNESVASCVKDRLAKKRFVVPPGGKAVLAGTVELTRVAR
jgi:hypothetical protein